jgi:C-terminal processing protease CtpA/Prc
MKSFALALAILATTAGAAAAQSDGESLRAYLKQTYPSLAYVDRYRAAFPGEIQGSDALWRPAAAPPPVATVEGLVRAMVGLQDSHVSVGDPKSSGSETLSVLFRTSTDGHMVVWRVLDPGVAARRGDVVLSIDGTPTDAWLQRAAASTFGGSHRSRAAAAALNLGVGSGAVHRIAGLGETVSLVVQSAGGRARTVSLTYRPMNETRAAGLSAALNDGDLPERFKAGPARVGTIRLGAFAPQYDETFIAASDKAEKQPGVSEDQAMIVGFCAVVNAFVARFDRVAGGSDVMVLDLRGNFGGFVREARLLALAMAPGRLARTWDVAPTAAPGTLRLEEQQNDPGCARVRRSLPLVVLTDAGTRSSGEFMAAWLWAAGSPVVGERTVGAGGGREFGAKPLILPSGLRVSASTNFSVFDPVDRLHEGEIAEDALIDQVTADRFAPDRTRPFAIQSVGMAPDVQTATGLDDLRDGGVGSLRRAMADLRRRGPLR